MNQKQKRQRILRIRKQQKSSKGINKQKAEKNLFIDHWTMSKRLAFRYRQLANSREKLLKIILLIGCVCTIFSTAILYALFSKDISFPKGEEKSMLISFWVLPAIIPWFAYFIFNDRWLIRHWKNQEKENSEFAENIKNHLKGQGEKTCA